MFDAASVSLIAVRGCHDSHPDVLDEGFAIPHEISLSAALGP